MNVKRNFVKFIEWDESEIEKINPPPHTLIRFTDGAADLTFVGIGCQAVNMQRKELQSTTLDSWERREFLKQDSHKTEAPVQELFAKF